MPYDYVIVQAGGKGTRLEHLTKNKPKCLVPVGNKPMLFHLFEKYPDKKYIIIGDYKYDVLEKYLDVFSPVDFELIDARGKKGTCAGIGNAVSLIPDNMPFILIWSDLILSDDFALPEKAESFVALSGDFPCRWKYENGVFSEERSVTHGVSGFFGFTEKSLLKNVDENGEFVRWLSQADIDLKPITLSKTREFGLLSEYNKIQPRKCRPFNSIEIKDDKIIKRGINEQGRSLAVREKAWYRAAMEYGFDSIPKIFCFEPLTMEKVDGKNLYEFEDLGRKGKYEILEKTVNALKRMHTLETVLSDSDSIEDAYITKTLNRINKVRRLIPFSENKQITVNNRKCLNIFKNEDILNKYSDLLKTDHFCFIHGDCTFSNTLFSDCGKTVFIDPRGYFGKTELFGDEYYDWAKLYYSIVGNYDKFNLKKFTLDITCDSVSIQIESNQWEKLEKDFFELIGCNKEDEIKIKLIHAIIWLSLTTYAWEDYDSICGAFYNGLWYLQDAVDLSEGNI
ncbi:MAG: nucleoside-diphosphate-sugar pyrophosphorylase [Clostridiales bacterium]|nr:nucleoside-diphosphate-sugar pyrophosphorylase [Clostridiales bacterium]